jgi:hypothetical protein
MMSFKSVAMATTVAALLSLVGTAQVQADGHHDSNTLHKIGNAIQNPVRKAGEDISVAVHRANNKKSVVVDRKDRAKYVVRPGGTMVYKSPTGKPYRHRKHRKHHTH